jgi:hypothetical protein
MVTHMQVGDKYKWYDGGGFWGNWNIQITDISNGIVTYIMTNQTINPPRIEKFIESVEKVEGYINRDDAWAWEKL